MNTNHTTTYPARRPFPLHPATSLITLLTFLLTPFALAAQLTVGDLSFVGFNVDGDDDFSIVALSPISASQTIYFRDDELDGTGNFVNANEGTLQWDTPASSISAGTVITFSDVDSASNPAFGVSLGSLSLANSSFNLGGSGDNLLAYQAAAFDASDPIMIAGLGLGETGDLGQSGLTLGTTFIDFGNSNDGGNYTGVRTGQAAFSDYLGLIGNSANWTFQGSNGENALPFNTTSFSAVPEPHQYALATTGLLILFAAIRRRARHRIVEAS